MNRKVVIDPKGPEGHENPKEFSELLADYNKISGSGSGSGNNWKLWSGIAAASVAVVFLAVFMASPDKSSELPALDSESITELENSTEADWSQMVSLNAESILVTANGTIIEIPENAFVLPKNMTSDSALLELTYLNDPVKVLRSQTPMSYDSAGVKYHFQSDGMFSIYCTAENEAINLQKPITIHYPQLEGRANSSTYLLTDNSWEYLETTEVKSKSEVCDDVVYRFTPTTEVSEDNVTDKYSTKTKELTEKIASLELNKPLEPKKQNLNNYRFTLDVKPSEFPELSSFENVIFEVKDSRFSWNIYNETWNDVSVKKSPKKGRYLITLKNAKRLEIFDVYPVLNEEQFSEAFTEYSNEMVSIENQKNQLQSEIEANKALEQKFYANLKNQKQAHKARTNYKKLVHELTADLEESTIYRTVELGSFCTVNFDIGIKLPAKGVSIPADFYIAQNNTAVSAVSLIDIEDNTYYNFSRAEFPNFRFIKNKEHIIASILPSGELAVYTEDLELNNLKHGVPFRFKLERTMAQNLDELKLYLNQEAL